MKLSSLSESYLLSLTQDGNNSYIELVLIKEDGEKYKIFANNKDSSPIIIEYSGLTLRANLTIQKNLPTLGEVESIVKNKSGFSFEGDMGYINIIADTLSIDNAL